MQIYTLSPGQQYRGARLVPVNKITVIKYSYTSTVQNMTFFFGTLHNTDSEGKILVLALVMSMVGKGK